MSEQLKDFLLTNSILCNHQTGFREKKTQPTAAFKVVNDFRDSGQQATLCSTFH